MPSLCPVEQLDNRLHNRYARYIHEIHLVIVHFYPLDFFNFLSFFCLYYMYITYMYEHRSVEINFTMTDILLQNCSAAHIIVT